MLRTNRNETRATHAIAEKAVALRASAIEAEALARAWEAVTYPTKKNGELFARLAQNISGAKVAVAPYSMSDELEASIYTLAGSKSVSDSIKLYETVSTYGNSERVNKALAETPERIEKRGKYLADVYRLSLDEVKEDIAKRARYWREVAQKDRETADRLREQLPLLVGLLDTLDEVKDEQSMTAYYALRDVAKSIL